MKQQLWTWMIVLLLFAGAVLIDAAVVQLIKKQSRRFFAFVGALFVAIFLCSYCVATSLTCDALRVWVWIVLEPVSLTYGWVAYVMNCRTLREDRVFFEEALQRWEADGHTPLLGADKAAVLVFLGAAYGPRVLTYHHSSLLPDGGENLIVILFGGGKGRLINMLSGPAFTFQFDPQGALMRFVVEPRPLFVERYMLPSNSVIADRMQKDIMKTIVSVLLFWIVAWVLAGPLSMIIGIQHGEVTSYRNSLLSIAAMTMFWCVTGLANVRAQVIITQAHQQARAMRKSAADAPAQPT